MGRTCRNCPVFGCGSTNLARLANHLDQVHGMDTKERTKWLKWSSRYLCISTEGATRGIQHGEKFGKTITA